MRAVAPTTQKTCGEKLAPRKETEETSLPLKKGRVRTDSPQARRAASRMTMERPMVVTIILRTPRRATRLRKTRSTATPDMAVKGDSRRHREREREEAGQGGGDHAPEHRELALGEVDDARGVVDDVEADGDRRVDAAVDQAGEEIL